MQYLFPSPQLPGRYCHGGLRRGPHTIDYSQIITGGRDVSTWDVGIQGARGREDNDRLGQGFRHQHSVFRTLMPSEQQTTLISKNIGIP